MTDQLSLEFSKKPVEKRVVVFDLETQLSADEVGGWNNKHLMRVAVGVVHDSLSGEFKVFYENTIGDLVELLKASDLVVGFNSRNFDYGVLQGYTDEPLSKTLPTFDILEEIQKERGFRIKLDNLARNTLGAAKSADGLQSLKWFKEGKLDQIRDYCIQDVKVTRDIFKHGLEKGFLFYSDKKGKKLELKTNWNLNNHYKKRG
ncbi:MAG: ribonuclease H-like domain-containing protein [Nitrospinota bacterium]